MNSVKYHDPEHATVLVDDTLVVPVCPGNRHWQAVQEWVAAGGVIEPFETPAEELARAKTDKVWEINAAFAAHVAGIQSAYPEGERATWPVQLEEARAYQADPTAATPMLSAMAAERGMTVAELAQRVRDKYAQFRAVVGPAVGRRHALIRAVEAAPDIAAVEAVEIIWP